MITKSLYFLFWLKILTNTLIWIAPSIVKVCSISYLLNPPYIKPFVSLVLKFICLQNSDTKLIMSNQKLLLRSQKYSRTWGIEKSYIFFQANFLEYSKYQQENTFCSFTYLLPLYLSFKIKMWYTLNNYNVKMLNTLFKIWYCLTHK